MHACMLACSVSPAQRPAAEPTQMGPRPVSAMRLVQQPTHTVAHTVLFAAAAAGAKLAGRR